MTLNRILQYGILGGLFAVLFLPLYVPETLFFPFITGKNFAFRIIVEILFGAWIVLALRASEFRPARSVILYGVVALTLVMAIATALSENPFKSFWSNYERMEGYITLLHLFAYFLVAGSMVRSEKLWERFFQVSLIANVILLGYGALQLLGKLPINQGGARVDATFGNTTYFAVYLLFHIFLAAFLALRLPDRQAGPRGAFWMRYIYGAIILADMFMLYYTATRGAILGLLGGVMLTTILIALFERNNTVLRKGAVGVLVAALLVPAAIFAFRDAEWVRGNQVLNRFASISLQETTTKSRFMVWNMAWQGFKERPVFGWGQESFNFVFNKYYDPRMYEQEPWFDRAHNVFLDWLIAGGILGLLAYLSLFGGALYLIWRREHEFSLAEKSVLTGLLAAYFFHNLFVFDNLLSYVLFFSLLAFLHARHTEGPLLRLRPGAGAAPGRSAAAVIIPPVVLVGTILVLYAANYHPLMANRTLINALKPKEDIQQNLESFKQVIARDSLGTSEAREQLSLVASQVVNAAFPENVKRGFAELAVSEMGLQTEWVPNDARYQLFTGALLNKFGRYRDALPYLLKAAELSPRKQQIYFELVTSYLNLNDYKTAVDVSRTAYELEPRYDDAAFIYATALIYAGDVAEAEKILALIEERRGSGIYDERVLKALVETKRYERALRMLEEKVAADPENAQRRLSLAALYVEMGKRTRAIEELQKVIAQNPSFKDQGEYYIREIRAGRNP